MKNIEFKQKLKTLGSVTRKSIQMSQDELIKTSYLQSDDSLPLVVQPNVGNLNLAVWSQHNIAWIEHKLLKHGGILFRGFQLKKVTEFQKFMQEISNNLLDYSYGSTPRSYVEEKIYTSTEYPADYHIILHNEMSYSRYWPMKIAFFCIKKALKGGETPIADSRKVLARIDTKIKEKFLQKKVMYVRNYGLGLDLTWQQAFNTNDKSEV
ncbi:MAG: TauD/TfdA family dioxygenase, partial [Cyanobacteria bacterium P01_G01_bin.49]